MDDLYFDLAKEEFSKGRKILIILMAAAALIITMWDSYIRFFKHNVYSTLSLTITLYLVTAFLIMIAVLATKKRKEHFFKIDNNVLSFHYGLLFPSHHTYNWNEIDKIYVPPHSKNATVLLRSGKAVHINLTWIEKNKSRIIRKHIFYTAKAKGIDIAKMHYKKK